MSVRRFSSSAEADRHDAAFWLLIPESERVLQAWRRNKRAIGRPKDLIDIEGLE